MAYNHAFVCQPLEDNTARVPRCSLPPVMRCVIKNRALYALYVFLIELKYKKHIRELHIPEDGPLSDDLVTAALTEWNTADRLVNHLYDEVGCFYADAVRRCIRCDFDRKSCCLDDVAFQKAVYQGVVSPLWRNYESLFAPEFTEVGN